MLAHLVLILPFVAVGDYGDLPSEVLNFQRPERLDVKKPGPFFKSDNNFAFDYQEPTGEDQQEEAERVGGPYGDNTYVIRFPFCSLE